MDVPVVLRTGEERTVDKDKFQFLLASRQILFFKRATSWVVVGRDQLRSKPGQYQGKERRSLSVYSKTYWY